MNLSNHNGAYMLLIINLKLQGNSTEKMIHNNNY